MKENKEIIFGKADLHVHSKYSWDSLSSIENILKEAKKKGLDIIAITDHNTIKGAQEAQRLAKNFGIEVIIGEEISTKDGHLIALFINEYIAPYQSALSTIKEIHKQDGLAIIPHPDNKFFNSISSRKLSEAFIETDGIEFFNGAAKIWIGNARQKELKRLNKKVFKRAAIAGSDSHLVRSVGCCYTFFIGNSSKDLYSAIKEKTTVVHGSVWNYRDKIFYFFTLPVIIYWNLFRLIKKHAKKVFKPF